MSEASLALTLAGAHTQRIEAGAGKPKKQGGRQVGLYTILLLPIFYGVWQPALDE